MFSLNKQKNIGCIQQWRAKSDGEMMQLNWVKESASGPKNIDLFQFLSELQLCHKFYSVQMQWIPAKTVQ